MKGRLNMVGVVVLSGGLSCVVLQREQKGGGEWWEMNPFGSG